MHRFAIKWLFHTHRCLYFICSKPQNLIQFAYKMAISDVCLVFSWFENFLKNHYFSIKWLIPRSHSAPRIYIKRLKPVHTSAILYGGILKGIVLAGEGFGFETPSRKSTVSDPILVLVSGPATKSWDIVRLGLSQCIQLKSALVINSPVNSTVDTVDPKEEPLLR